MPWSNYHSHTNFSDGSENPENYIEEALKQGLNIYGFSCHAPVPFETDWCMKKEKLQSYIEVIRQLQEKYMSSIQILLALEIDYIPGLISPSDELFRMSKLDYVIGSIHFVDSFQNGNPWGIDGSADLFRQGMEKIWKGEIREAVHRYYSVLREMITLATPDIIGHIDKIRMHNEGSRYFSEEDSWYRKEVFQSLEVMRSSNCLLEVNTRGMYRGNMKEPYPSLWILKEAFKMGIKLVLNSDAHMPQEITGMFAETAVILEKTGYKELYNRKDSNWQPFSFTSKGLNI